MPNDGRLTNAVPGPRASEASKTGRVRLPAPLAAGILPPDDSRLWLFVPRSVQQGESFIQDDTRDWFRDRGGKVVVCREYPDHPRWVPLNKSAIRAAMHNAQIVSEVHMLARLAAGRPEYPDWVPARMTVKQQQADLSFRLTKATREVFVKAGKEAMEMFAARAPGQFVKFVGATFIPKKIESDVVVRPGEILDPEMADQILAALNEELQRRSEEAKLVATTNVLDYDPPAGIVDMVADTAGIFEAATAPTLGERMSIMRKPDAVGLHRNLKRVVDLEADVPAETEWD